MEAIKYAKLCLDGTIGIFVIQNLSKRLFNKLLAIKTETKTSKIQNSVEKF